MEENCRWKRIIGMNNLFVEPNYTSIKFFLLKSTLPDFKIHHIRSVVSS